MGLVATALLRQHRLRVSPTLVGCVGPSLAADVHRGIAGIIGRLSRPILVSRPEALEARPCLDQRSIDREVLVRKGAAFLGDTHHPIKEPPAHLMFQQTPAVLGAGVSGGTVCTPNGRIG